MVVAFLDMAESLRHYLALPFFNLPALASFAHEEGFCVELLCFFKMRDHRPGLARDALFRIPVARSKPFRRLRGRLGFA